MESPLLFHRPLIAVRSIQGRSQLGYERENFVAALACSPRSGWQVRHRACNVRAVWSGRRVVESRFLVTLLAGVVTTACQNTDNGAPDTGAVRIALTLPGGLTVNQVSWQVLSATQELLASGITNTSNPSATPSLSFSVPPGIGETVHMSATTTSGSSCTGTSEPFNVVAGQMVSVLVSIVCGPAPTLTGLGSVTVTGILVAGDNCPVLASWSLSPLETAANGGTIDVNVGASDADPTETVSFAWSATSGSFSAPTAATTQFVCGAAGSSTLSVTISDNHQPVSCSLRVSFPPVNCL